MPVHRISLMLTLHRSRSGDTLAYKIHFRVILTSNRPLSSTSTPPFFAAAAAAHATGLVVAGHASAVVVMPLLMPLKQPSLPLLMFTIIPTNEFL